MNSRGAALPEDEAAFYFCQLLRAVLFMHSTGFTHRDIKPENCVLERRSHMVKVIWGRGGGGGVGALDVPVLENSTVKCREEAACIRLQYGCRISSLKYVHQRLMNLLSPSRCILAGQQESS